MTPTPEELHAIYRAYPRHLAPREAKEAIRKAIQRNGFTVDQVMQLVEDYKQQLEQHPIPTKSIPYPSTWFNQERWDEDFSERREMVMAMIDQEKANQPPPPPKLNFL